MTHKPRIFKSRLTGCWLIRLACFDGLISCATWHDALEWTLLYRRMYAL